MIGTNDATRTDNGSATISPNKPVVAGSQCAFTITYVAGEQGIRTGGCLRLSIWRYWCAPQLDEPQAAGFVSVSCPKGGIVLKTAMMDPKATVLSGSWYRLESMPPNAVLMQKYHALYMELVEGELEAGETVTITYRSTAPATSAIRYPFRLATDPDGSRNAPYSGFSYVAESPEILVHADEPGAIEAFVPSYIEGRLSPSHVRVVGRDRYANPCRPGQQPDIDIKNDRANVICGRFKTVSNYAKSASNDDAHCYWGDLHVHSQRSDGLGRLEDVYDYARDVMGLDFVGHGDHTQYMSDQDWEQTKEITRRMNDPGHFVSFPGFELSHNHIRVTSNAGYGGTVPYYGDKNVYYLNEDNAPILRVTDRYRSYYARFLDIVEQIRGRQAMIIPHIHAGGVMTFYDPDLVWLLEAFSAHHFGVRGPGHKKLEVFEGTVQQCLAAGWRVGLVGGSDNHNARAAQNTYFPWDKENRRDSLMAVWTTELTRQALWDAMRRRCVYATTGARMLLDVRLNGAPMGSEIALDEALTPKELTIEVHGTAPLARVDVLRSNELLRQFKPSDWDFQETFVDQEYSSAETFYQVKVLQQDGNMAWSTPIWVDLTPAARVNFTGQEQTWAR